MSATPSSLDRESTGSYQQRLIRIVRDWSPEPGMNSSAIDGVQLLRTDAPSRLESSIYEPSLGFVIQGRKTVQLGDREIVYGALSYLANTVHLPVLGHIADATPERPYLAVKLAVSPREVTELVLESADQLPEQNAADECPELSCGLCMARMDLDMQTALTRLLSLLDTPRDIPVLAPLARREILYRALVGELGPRIRKFAATDSQAHRISKVIATLKDNFDRPLRVGELADASNMSESTLFHSFKQVTRMSPLQYQKKLRLHEARRLMLSEGLEAAVASYRVGYESPSQFSREYSRMFGAPPRADVTKLRGESESPRVQ